MQEALGCWGDWEWPQLVCCLAVSFMSITSAFLQARNLFCCEKENRIFFFSLGKINKGHLYSTRHSNF